MFNKSLTIICWTVLLTFLTSVAAYPYDHILPRATSPPSSSAVKSIPENDSASPIPTAAVPNKTGSGSETTAKPKGTTATKNGKGTATITDIPDTAIAGQVSMVTPALTDGSQYYGIGDYVTFAWNYTDVIIQPRVRVQAYDQINQIYLDIATNLSATQTQVVWDTKAQQAIQSIPFDQAIYTLVIFDENLAGGATAIPSAGYLQPQKIYKFGMYYKAAAVSPNQFQCPFCDSAASALDIKSVKFLMALGMITAFTMIHFIGVVA